MSIEQLVNTINSEIIELYKDTPPPVTTEDEIAKLKEDFLKRFNYNLPAIFEKLLSFSNGVLFNGLTIWPTRKYGLFQESFVEANSHLKESFNKDFIYFGTRDEELYIYSLLTQEFQAIEYVDEAEWQKFSSAEQMLEFMLNRALD
jgi:hypothetical protein